MASRSKRRTAPWLLLTALVAATLATWASHKWIERGKIPLSEYPSDVGYGLVWLNELVGLSPGFRGEDWRPIGFPSPRAQAYYHTLAERAKAYCDRGDLRMQELCTQDCGGRSDANMGWPFISRRYASYVDVIYVTPDGESSAFVFYADMDGSPPTQYAGLAANFAIYFAATVFLLLWGGSSTGRLVLKRCWRAILKLSSWYQCIRRPIRKRWVICAMVLLGSLATWVAHEFVEEEAEPCWYDLTLYVNRLLGLPSNAPWGQDDPDSDVPSEFRPFCQLICARLEPFIRQHDATKTGTLSAEVKFGGFSRGWPLKSHEAVATVQVEDRTPAGKNVLLLKWEVDGAADHAFKPYRLFGNWLFLMVATLLVLWLIDRLLLFVTFHIMRTQPSFAVVVLPASASGDEASA